MLGMKRPNNTINAYGLGQRSSDALPKDAGYDKRYAFRSVSLFNDLETHNERRKD